MWDMIFLRVNFDMGFLGSLLKRFSSNCTIFALASANGRAGVGVIRISGASTKKVNNGLLDINI